MNYKQVYDNLIERAKIRKLEGKFIEHHHIVPISCGGKDILENIVTLYPREHYIAHKLLHFIYPNNNSLKYAYCMMTFTTLDSCKKYERISTDRYYHISGKDYEYCRKIASELCSIQFKGKIYVNNKIQNKIINIEDKEEYIKNGWLLGKKPFTEDALKSIREKARNRTGKMCLDSRKKKSNSVSGEKNPCYGRITINNGKLNKKVYPNEIEEYLNKGWSKGQICLTNKSLRNKLNGVKKGKKDSIKGRTYVHTEEIPYLIRYSLKSDVEYYKKIGWKLGRGKHIKEAKENIELNKKYFYYIDTPKYSSIRIPTELIPLYEIRGYKPGKLNFLSKK